MTEDVGATKQTIASLRSQRKYKEITAIAQAAINVVIEDDQVLRLLLPTDLVIEKVEGV